VILHGRLNKTDPGQYETFLSLYRDAHFFIMPSRQEAYGIVYCEAAAFGRPAIAAQTGGVGTIVGDDRTGLLFPLEATPADYADRILALWSQPEAYVAMPRRAEELRGQPQLA
jgi:glycosyltransferase involved in cell wall biosynthesis